MFKRYTEYGRLQGGHDNSVTTLSFSPFGRYIATAALDGTICIWEVLNLKLLCQYSGNDYAVSIAWFPGQEAKLLAGMARGSILSLSFSEARLICSHRGVLRLTQAPEDNRSFGAFGA